MSTPSASHHPSLWFPDGNLILKSKGTALSQSLIKVHRTVWARHSRFIDIVDKMKGRSAGLNTGSGSDCLEIQLDQVNYIDLEAFLLHVYNIAPLSSHSSYSTIASVLRASSPTQLDSPDIHQLAREYFQGIFPDDLVVYFDHPELEDAAKLALEYDILPSQKLIYYALIRTTNAGHDHTDPDHPTPDLPSPLPKVLSHLLSSIVSHFTPILFTPATSTTHMECTDVFAETWMDLVIGPALGNDDVYKPLESLERIRNIAWTEKGLCEKCTADKREEWRQEMETLWKAIDEWIAEGEEL